MDIFFAVSGTAGTLVFVAVSFIVLAIAADLLGGKTPSVNLANLAPWLAGATFVGFVYLNMWCKWPWFWYLGWASVGLAAAAMILKLITHRRDRRDRLSGVADAEDTVADPELS